MVLLASELTPKAVEFSPVAFAFGPHANDPKLEPFAPPTVSVTSAEFEVTPSSSKHSSAYAVVNPKAVAEIAIIETLANRKLSLDFFDRFDILNSLLVFNFKTAAPITTNQF